MPLSFFFGLFLALAQMTTLRGAAPIGVLDVLLVGSAGAAALWSLVGASPIPATTDRSASGAVPNPTRLSAAANPVAQFAAVALVAITVTLLINLQNPAASIESLPTAAIAFYATFAVTICICIVLAGRNATGLVSGFIVASTAVGLVYSAGSVIGLDAMYYESRFSGFSANPNQASLQALCSIVVSLLVIAGRFIRGKMLQRLVLLNIALSFFYGLMTLGDAFILCLPVVAAAIGLMLARHYSVPISATVATGIMGAAIALVTALIVFPDLMEGILGSVFAASTVGDQDTIRFLLWQNGIAAWEARMLVGNGPGAWSGVGAPFQGLEAHNSVIDWLSIAGVMGAIPLLVMFVRLALPKSRIDLVTLLCLAAMILFSMFHFVYRLPVFWLTLAILAQTTAVQSKRAAGSPA